MSPHATHSAHSPSSTSLSRSLPRWRVGTFRALRHRNYRLYFCGQFVSVTGSWAQSAALMWLAYDLTKESSWPAWVGSMQVLPAFVLSVWGGSLADRWPKRALIFTTQALLLLLALLLGGVVLLGHINPWVLLAVATAAGIVNAVDLPARLSFVIDMVGREDLPNAIALNSMLFNLARMVGPIGSGVLFSLIGRGETVQTAAGVCFLLNGLSFVAVLAALAWMELPPALPPLARSASDGQSNPSLALRASEDSEKSPWAGFRYLRQHPRLILLLILAGAMSLFGWPILPLLPAVADQRLHGSTGAYAWMLSAIGGGAGVASLLVASSTTSSQRRWCLAAGVVLASSSLLGLSMVRSLPLAMACCASLGCGLILFFPTGQAIMQLRSDDAVRGRIMGIWSMVHSGAFPLGHLLAGKAADRWLNHEALDDALGKWLARQPGEPSGVPLVLALMGLGIAAASALVFLLLCVHSFASNPRLRR